LALRRSLVWACLLTTAPIVLADAPALPVEDLFKCLWVRRTMFTRSGYHMYEVEVVGAWPKGSGSRELKLKLVDDLKSGVKSLKPEVAKVRVSLVSNRVLADRTGAKRYLAIMRPYTSRNQKKWAFYNLGPLPRTTGGKTIQTYYYLLSIDGYGAGFWKAFRELLATSGGGQEAPFNRMVSWLTGPDKEARTLAACFAGVNGWGYRDDAKTASQPDAFARALLGMKDPKPRALAARAYSAAKADLLPRDPGLLKGLFAHTDKDVYTPALHDGLRRASKRADALAGLIRPALGGPDCRVEQRTLILSALTGWGEEAGIFAPELEAIVRGRARPPGTELDRVTALRLCVDAGCEDTDQLVLDTIEAVPSAVALEYAVNNRIYALVPAVIRAARAGKLQWTDTHRDALALLTRRHVDADFEAFDTWWAEMEKAGRADAAVRDGFPDPAAVARCRELIAQLASGRYKVREAARTKLSRIAGAALGELEKAADDPNPEVAASAAEALTAAKARFKGSADRLAAAAKGERAGKTFLPHAE